MSDSESEHEEEYLQIIKGKTNFTVPTLNIADIKLKLETLKTPDTTDDEFEYPWETRSHENQSNVHQNDELDDDRLVNDDDLPDDDNNWVDINPDDNDDFLNEPTPTPKPRKLTTVLNPKPIRFTDDFIKKFPKKRYV